MAVRCQLPLFSEVLFFISAFIAVTYGFIEPRVKTGEQLIAVIQNKELGETIDTAVNEVLSRTSHPSSLLAVAEEASEEKNLGTDNAQCLKDLSRWKTAFSSRESWALKMVDSTSKTVVGVLYGVFGDLGDFDECVEATPGTIGTGDDFTGLFALPTLTVQTRTNVSLTDRKDQQKKILAASDTNYGWPDEVSLRFAICAPSTCSAEFLQAALQNKVLPVINNATQNLGVRLTVSLSQEHTSLYSGYRQPDSLDWSIVSLSVFLASIVALATIIDLFLGDERLKAGHGWVPRLVVAFSARINGKKLMTVSPPGGDTLSCMHGIRTLSLLWIVQGHRWGKDVVAVPQTNLIVAKKYIYGNYAFTTLVYDAILAVDTFFVLGGILNTYVFLKTVKRTRSFNLLKFYVHRYIRLAPALMFVLAVSATWLSLIGNGPVWYYVNETSESCREAWWTHLLFVANYVRPQHQCQVLWFPSVDMQLYWVSPLVLVPLWKWPRLGVPWLLLLILASCAVPFQLAYENGYRFTSPLFEDLRNTDLWAKLYYPTHMRASPYFVGLFTGYIIYLIKVEKRTFKINNVLALAGWVLSAAMCMVVLLAVCPLRDSEHIGYNKLASSFYIGFARFGWAVGLSWVVIACVTGHGGPINSFLSCTPFAIIGRLTYGIYLAHNTAQIVDRALSRSADFYNPFKLTHATIADFFIGIVLAFVLSLLIESPLIVLEKWLWEPKKSREHSAKETVAGKVAGV